MTKLQFRVLYREFLFRVVDLELIAPQGDMSRLLGQFAALLIFLSVLFSTTALGLGDSRMPRPALLIGAWGSEHFLIATTMLVVGLFAVLSWDSTFPDRRDVMVLGPLPVRTDTLFLAKIAASASALSFTVAAINAMTGLCYPLALAPAASNLLYMITSPGLYRAFAAYWITMLAAGAFIYCSLLGIQGAAAHLLPRRGFLRVSAFLQMAAFCLFVSVYFLQPSLATPKALAAPENQRLLALLPSYWFLGMFQQLNGSMHPATAPLAQRAWAALAVSILGTGTAYLVSYFRTLRKIAEEPDIVPGSHGPRWTLPFGNSLETAVVHFSVRTLLRSRQHRVMFAFYLGIGFGIITVLLKSGVARGQHLLSQPHTQLLFSSFVIMCVWVVGTRVVFSMPLAIRSNWMFRITEIRGPREYLAAIRRTLFILAVAPVWAGSALLFLSIWPWRAAVEHLVVLGLWGMILAYVCLHNFQKIPFTCSYLPGKSAFHMTFLAAVWGIVLIGRGAEFERQALDNPVRYAWMVLVLCIVAGLARWRTVALATTEEAMVQFEEVPPPAVLVLGLYRDGALHIDSGSR